MAQSRCPCPAPLPPGCTTAPPPSSPASSSCALPLLRVAVPYAVTPAAPPRRPGDVPPPREGPSPREGGPSVPAGHARCLRRPSATTTPVPAAAARGARGRGPGSRVSPQGRPRVQPGRGVNMTKKAFLLFLRCWKFLVPKVTKPSIKSCAEKSLKW